MRHLSGKSEFFRFESNISWTGFKTLQISKRIDAAVGRGPNLRRQSLESELKFMFLITKLALNGPHDLWFWEWLKTVVTSFVHYW